MVHWMAVVMLLVDLREEQKAWHSKWVHYLGLLKAAVRELVHHLELEKAVETRWAPHLVS